MSTGTATRAPRPPRPSRPPRGRRPSHYVLLIATVMVLNVVGVVMVLSASSVVSLTDYGSAWYFFWRQLVWTALGIVGFVFALRIDYRRWRQWVRPLLFITFGLMTLVLVPGVGIRVSGASRWLGFDSWRFQPTELAKLAVVLFAAELLCRRIDPTESWPRVLKPILGVTVGLGALLCLQPDLDSAVLLAVIVGAILVAGGVASSYLVRLAGVGIAVAGVLAIAAPYRRARVFAFLDPSADASNTGYQIVQSLIALAEGGVEGVGLGAGRAKWLFLPNAHTDFIFSVIGEELGLLGTFSVLGLFAVFAVLGMRIARRAPDRFGMLVAAGLTIWIVVQAAVNMGVAVGLLPVSGIPLPFVSFGGSSLVFTMIAAGILANIARQAR